MDTPIHDKQSETLEQRFLRNTVVNDHGRIWTGAISGRYGQMAFGGDHFWVHRVAWELANGPIPPGMHVDHDPACPKSCVTPSHLQLLTPSEHIKLGWARGEYEGRKNRPVCSIPECGMPHQAKGYCIKHYKRLIRNGDPLTLRSAQ